MTRKFVLLVEVERDMPDDVHLCYDVDRLIRDDFMKMAAFVGHWRTRFIKEAWIETVTNEPEVM